MADAPARFCQFVRDQVQTSSLPLVAILLSAGGNDSTGDTLAGLINLKAPAKPVLDDALLKKHLDGIEANYKTILKAIGAALAASGADTVPVIVHGYDYPYPDGRQGLRLWLDEPFTDRGYDPVNDRQARVKAMRDLIDQLNVRLASLPGVHYIDLRGTIETTWPANPTEAWDNDLHPEDEPFRLFALKIDAEIDRLAAPTSVAVAAAPGPGATPSALPRKPRKPARP